MGNSVKIAPFDHKAYLLMKYWYAILSPFTWFIKQKKSDSYDAVSSHCLMVEVTDCNFQTIEFCLESVSTLFQ